MYSLALNDQVEGTSRVMTMGLLSCDSMRVMNYMKQRKGFHLLSDSRPRAIDSFSNTYHYVPSPFGQILLVPDSSDSYYQGKIFKRAYLAAALKLT